MFHQQRGHAPLGDLLQNCGDLLNHLRAQALGRLVNHHQIGVPHQRAAHGQHLLLAARHHRRLDIRAFAEVREHIEHVLHRPAACAILLAGFQPKDKVLPRGQPRKDIAVFGHIADAQVGHFKRLFTGDFLTAELDGAMRDNFAHDRLAGGRSPHPVAAQKGDDLALLNVQVHPLQDVRFAIIGVQIVDFEHQCSASSAAPR